MSRPGFPIDMKQSITVNNSYTTWNGITTNGTDTLSNYRTRYEDKVGNNTPGWPGTIQTNSYLRSVFTWEQQPLNVNGTNTTAHPGHTDTFSGQWGNTFGLGWSPWLSAPSTFSTGNEQAIVRSRLIGKLIDNIQSHRVNLGEILHTRAQAASMVASTANRLAGTFLSLRRGNFVGAARYLTGAPPRTRRAIGASGSGRTSSSVGGIPEQWLALQYGWKPLLQDVYNSCETVRKAWNDTGELFTAEAHASATGPQISVFRNKTQPHGPTFRVETTRNEVHGNASVTYGVSSNFGNSLSQLGITNPLSLAWELLPYSFVVDWFFPVGSFLERLDYANGLVFRHGWLSMKASQDVRQRLESSVGVGGGNTANWSGGTASGTSMVMTREVLSSFPSVPPPRLKDPFSLTHVANALSLLATAFRGGKIPR